MAQLHELLAAEKVPTAAWNQIFEETKKKFSNAHFFNGHSKSLKMLDESEANKAIEEQAREEKEVVTTVYDTLEYALSLYATAEDVQYQKNATNQEANGQVTVDGLNLPALPVDELLGLENRLQKIRELMVTMPTLDASVAWNKDTDAGKHIYITAVPKVTTKTEKTIFPIEMSPATDKHPAQIQAATRDMVIGKFTVMERSGAATAAQKADCILRVDSLLAAIKRARMRANETEIKSVHVGNDIVNWLLQPLKES